MLRDHFHLPLKVERKWGSFHAAWAVHIADDLSLQLPEFYIAQPQTKFGIEIDVAAFEERGHINSMVREAMAVTAWTAAAAAAMVDP